MIDADTGALQCIIVGHTNSGIYSVVIDAEHGWLTRIPSGKGLLFSHWRIFYHCIV